MNIPIVDVIMWSWMC